MNAASRPLVSFRAIKERVSIKDILGQYGLLEGLTPKGKDALSGPCPVHKGTHPDQFRVSLTKNCWNCFGPCAGGNILDLVAQLEGVSLAEAARLIDGWFPEKKTTAPSPKRRTPKRSAPEHRKVTGEAPRDEKAALEAPESEEGDENPVLPFERLKNLDFGHAYLRGERGFDRATLEHFGVGFCTKGMHRGRIAIPIHNRHGQLVSYAGYERETGQYRYHEAFRPELELFNLHRVMAETAVATEGIILTVDYFDVLRLYEAGLRNAVALPSEALSDRQLGLLAECVGEGGKITLVLAPGFSRTLETLLALSGRFYVRLVQTERRLSDLRNAEVRERITE